MFSYRIDVEGKSTVRNRIFNPDVSMTGPKLFGGYVAAIEAKNQV